MIEFHNSCLVVHSEYSTGNVCWQSGSCCLVSLYCFCSIRLNCLTPGCVRCVRPTGTMTTRSCSWCSRGDSAPVFRGSDNICLTEPRPSTSTAPHPTNYQSAASFHKAPQPDRLSSSPTRKTCPTCSIVTQASMCLLNYSQTAR